MPRFAPAPLPGPTEAPSGFTLLELVISLTITTMVVLVVYSAFSLGVRVWERQGQDTEAVRRDEIMFRLLDRDFAEQAPYVMHLDGASLSLTAGGPTAFFYVTRNGFGALRREDKALFFTCLFVAEDDENGLGLYLYKIPEPSPDFVREIRSFVGMLAAMRSTYAPPVSIRQKAVRLAGGFKQLSFSYAADGVVLFAGSEQDVLQRNQPDAPLKLDDWTGIDLPGQVQLLYERADEDEVGLLFLPGLGKV
ncbi:PulJ/GspJ family protein [Desulfonatronum thioautotrophicum]|uniref:PulJ/GspJ family protein n=1 Tax=Desulfonatronum thioautotrophicum TaxID=617001 RepID=UPI0005EAE89D|nr:prepilin-type N-terminal cleavage/methylation domain-containing protein [Desulfonatronum thioautotrophicum]